MKLFVRILFASVLALNAHAQLFTDDFTRGTDPGPISPWVVAPGNQAGNWTVTGGALRGGPNTADSFGFAYLTNNWTDYSVQARVRFSNVNADAGGIGGRLNPNSGGHYAAWISPDGSGTPNTLLLAKFQFWEVYEYTNTTWQEMARVSLPAVGTNWHNLKVNFQGNQIQVYYDNTLMITAVDIESNPILSGGIIVGQSSDSNQYLLYVDDVVVNALPSRLMALNDSYSVAVNGSLTVPAPGVLNNDTAGSLPNLSAIRIANPSRGTLNLNANGGFTYVPNANFTGIDSFTYATTDGSSTTAVATVTVDVLPSGNIFYDNFTRTGPGSSFAPWVIGLGDWNVSGNVLLGSGTLNDYYSDAYIPGTWTDFSVQERFQLPTGAWACGISGRVNPVTGERYVANVYPETSPFKPTPALRLIKFHSWGTWSSSYTAMALVSLPSVGTSYHTLKMACYGNTIDVYYDGNLVVHAIDNNTDGIPFYRSGAFGAHMYMYTPNYTATFDDFQASVLPGVNSPPGLPAQIDRTISRPATLVVTNTASDPDLPANSLTYSLLSPPSGAAIDSNGIITWTPSAGQDSSTNTITTVVTDYNPSATNAQHLSATNSFKVIVASTTGQSSIALDSTSLVGESCSPPNGVVDPGEVVTINFSLKNVGSANTTNLVATLLTGNGVTSPSGPQSFGVLTAGGAPVTRPFTFAATGACGLTINAVIHLQDGANDLGNIGSPMALGQTATVFSQAFDGVSSPSLPVGWTTTASGGEPAWVTQNSASSSTPNSAFVPDQPSVGVSEIVSPAIALPFGSSTLSFANSFDFETNNINTSEAYDGGVLDIKIGNNAFTDILSAGGSFMANGYLLTISQTWSNPLGGRLCWSGNSGGFMTTMVALPPAAAGQTIQLRWRAGTDNSNGRTGWRIDSVNITGTACCSGSTSGPYLSALPDRTTTEMTTLTVTNTATDADTPPANLTYSLSNPPANAAIDANGIITFTPSEAQGPGTFSITTVVTDNSVPPLGATNSFSVTVNESNRPPVLPAQTNRTIVGLASLTVTNTATDPDLPANPITYSLTAAPTNASINSSGIITWTPAVGQVPSTNTFTTVATDTNAAAINSNRLSATNNFTVVVSAVHNGPSLTGQADRTINELTTLQVTNTATDNDIPVLSLNYSLVNPPAGASINQNGVISWSPTEVQGPGTNTITTIVSDNGSPVKSATNSFVVVVNEVNQAPVLPSQTNRTITGMVSVVVTNTATDADLPANLLNYVLTGPSNAVISALGVISWTPSLAQVPSTNIFTTVVTDSNPSAVNSQNLSATNSFTVVVNAIHNGPSLGGQPNYSINELTTLHVTNTASDSDIPALSLSYVLQNPPTGVSIDANGVITWTPTESQGPSTNLIVTEVTDNGTPQKRSTNSFQVFVNELNDPPVLPTQTTRTITGLANLVVTNTATDPDLPANTLTYALTQAPSTAAIDANGIITWTPVADQVPSTNVFTTVVTDFNPAAVISQHLSATNSFLVVVNPVHNGPVLPAQTNVTISELSALLVTNTAIDNDIPSLSLAYALIDPPAGATIGTNGVITWTPSESQGPGPNVFNTLVTDDGSPAKSSTNSFVVVVHEVNEPPVLPVQTNRTIAGLTTLVVTNTATDPDLPANPLTYTLAQAPTNASIDADGIITWTPVLHQVPGANVFVTIVSDFNPAAVNATVLRATNSFTVVVQAVRNPPMLPNQADRTIQEPMTLVVTNTASEDDVPVLPLIYQLAEAPIGASIDTNGLITWTPDLAQAASTNLFETIVSDANDASALTATNKFFVFVESLANSYIPILQSISISNDVVNLMWSAISNRTYRVQYKTEFLDSNWVDLLPDVLATGPTANGTDTSGLSTQRFYRVILLP